MFLPFSQQNLINTTLVLEVGSRLLKALFATVSDVPSGWDQTRRGWLERSIFNILVNQENVTSESSKNVSKATAGKCIRDTGTCVFTGGAVGHLATILTRYT